MKRKSPKCCRSCPTSLSGASQGTLYDTGGGKERGWERDAWRGLPRVPDHELSPCPGNADWEERDGQEEARRRCLCLVEVGLLEPVLQLSCSWCGGGVRWLVSSSLAKPAFLGDVKGLYS